MKCTLAIGLFLSSLTLQPIWAQTKGFKADEMARFLASRDPATGLEINLSSDFVVKRYSTKGLIWNVFFVIDPASGRPPPFDPSIPHLCSVGFIAVPDAAEITQDQFNQLMTQTDYMHQTAERFSAHGIKPENVKNFQFDGITGLEFTGLPTKGGSYYEDGRVVMSLLFTPRGATAVFCTTDRANFDAVIQLQRTIRNRVSPPR